MMVESDDKYSCLLEEAMALELPFLKYMMKNKIKKHPSCPLLTISKKELFDIIDYCNNQVDSSSSDSAFVAEFVKESDPLTLFYLIKIAHHLKIKGLMDFTCQIFVGKVKAVESQETMIDIDLYIDQTFSSECSTMAHSSDTMSPVHQKGFVQNVNNLLRSHGKETFISQSDFLDVQSSPFLAHEVGMLFTNQRIAVFESCVKDLMNSSEPLMPSESMAFSNLEKLYKSTKGLEFLINGDRSLADHLSSEVAHRLLQILKVIDRKIIECQCVSILSCASFDKCHDVIKEEALPLFVGLLRGSDYHQLVVEVVIALTRLAYAYPDSVQFIIKKGALEAAQKISRIYPGSVEAIQNLAKFLVAICRGEGLSLEKFTSDEVKVTLTIVNDLFYQKLKSNRHIVWTCYALSYLSFERKVPIGEEAFKRLIGFISHEDYSVAGSALGVVGNIARWGSDYHIQFLATNSELLLGLGRRWLRCEFKLFRTEACQIISNIAAQSEIFRKNMDKYSLKDPLCRLLEDNESDVKMEAAWSLFNSLYVGKYVEGIDNIDYVTLMAT